MIVTKDHTWSKHKNQMLQYYIEIFHEDELDFIAMKSLTLPFEKIRKYTYYTSYLEKYCTPQELYIVKMFATIITSGLSNSRKRKR